MNCGQNKTSLNSVETGFQSDCPSLMHGIAIRCIQHSQTMFERGDVSLLTLSFIGKAAISQFQKTSDADQSWTFIIKLLINMSLRVYLIKLYTVQDICLISLFILIICRHHHWEVFGKTHYGHKLPACQNKQCIEIMCVKIF